MPIDLNAIADSAAVLREAKETLRAELAVAEPKVAALQEKIAALRSASIPPSDVIQFLKDYIDAKAGEYLQILNYKIAAFVKPSRGDALTLSGNGKPLSFDEYETLLTPSGEEFLGHQFWLHAGGSIDGTPVPKTKMLALMTLENEFGWGRAFCFFFGEQMKQALDANADKIAVPELNPSEMHESTREQRRALIATLEEELSKAKWEVGVIQGQMSALDKHVSAKG